MTPRAQAARILAGVIGKGQSLDRALPAAAPAAARALCYEVLRFGPRLEFFAASLLKSPLKPQDADVHALLLIGIYELEYSDTPDYAAVSGVVEATRGLHKGWAAKLVNAVLRRFLREREALRRAADKNAAARFAHPDWLLAQFQADWPQHWQTLAAAGNVKGPMWLRVNQRRIATSDYRQQLQRAGMDNHAPGTQESAICLDHAANVAELPGFSKGLVSVQDAAAQWAAPLLMPEPGQRILDACAAPGGKTAHILEHCPEAEEVVALDVSQPRLKAVRANLERLGHPATVMHGDARHPEAWWDGRPFERILLDAPCSGSGVIRRHPDIKWLKRAADLDQLAHTQRNLLAALWPLLANGGRLLYSTCSVLRQENAGVVAGFMQQRDDATQVPVAIPGAIDCEVGCQILPGQDMMDGFYYACLAKKG